MDTIQASRGPRTLRALCHSAQAIAIEKGWASTSRDPARRHLLFLSEVLEAFEDVRAGRRPATVHWEVRTDGPDKPGGIPIELADVAIRFCQDAAMEGFVEAFCAEAEGCEGVYDIDAAAAFDEHLALLVDLLRDFSRTTAAFHPKILGRAMAALWAIARATEIDLWAAIECKEAYNRTRPHRHGGKAF